MERRGFIKKLSLPLIGLLLGNCNKKVKLKGQKNYIWINLKELQKNTWEKTVKSLKANGVDGLLVQADENNLMPINNFTTLAKKYGLEVHFWIITMKHNKKKVKEEHPEWYVINREGVSCLENPPYVKDYRWLCPSRESVKNYVQNRCKNILDNTNVDGIHLDYIRYPDVILPEAIQPEYGLNQTKELARFDYCYCEVCRKKFKEKYGKDPLEMKKPAKNKKWKEYRYNQITKVVKKVDNVVRKNEKKLTAAVFPTPNIARNLVRQDWTEWPLNAVFPMMYHNFYNKPVSWIEKAAQKGTKALKGNFPLYSGIFVPELKPEEIKKAARSAKLGGAKGVSIFDLGAMTKKHWQNFDK